MSSNSEILIERKIKHSTSSFVWNTKGKLMPTLVNPVQEAQLRQLPETLDRMEMAQEMPSLTSVLALEESVSVALPNHNPGAEEMLKSVDGIYSPILKAMKLLGMYFGETSVKRFSSVSWVGRPQASVSLLYCCAVAASLWFNFVMAVISICMEGFSVPVTFYTLTTLSMWCLSSAVSGTICMLVLPLTDKKLSRLEKFLRRLLESNIDLQAVQTRSRKSLIMAGIMVVIAVLSIIIGFIFVPAFSIVHFKPWNGCFPLRVYSVVALMYTCGTWLLPFVLVCDTCLVLECLFDDFYKKASSLNANVADFKALREEHCRLCQTAEHASKMFSPLLLGLVCLYTPLMCFQFFNAVNPPPLSEESPILFVLLGLVFWLVGSAGILALVMVFGSRVNEKVRMGTD